MDDSFALDKNVSVESDFNFSIEAKKILGKVVDFILDDGKVNIIEQDNSEITLLEIKTKNPAIIIGRHGHTLDAIQYLVNILINRRFKENKRKKIIIDIEDYREKRKSILTKYAKEKADIVKKTRKEIVLCSMNAAERRIIHVVLQDDPLVHTFSEGIDPYRKVIITPLQPKKETL